MSCAADLSTDSTRPWWKVSEWWYLGYLGMLLFQPAFDPDSGLRSWAVTGVGAAAFVVLWVLHLRRPQRYARFGAPVSALLGAAVFPFNGGATVFLIYAAAFAASSSPRRTAMRWFAGLSLVMVALGIVSRLPWPIALAVFALPLFFIWVVGVTVLDRVDRDEEAGRLRIDNARIEHLATAAERDRISRDLHDLLGQSLTEVIVRAQLVRRLVDQDPGRAADEVMEIERSSRRALDEVRAAVQGWREVRIDEELEIATRALDAAGVAVVVDRAEGFDPPPTTETVMALALREAVTNVVRHAGASTCTITLRRNDGQDVLEIVDDGHGGTAEEGLGMTGMRERVLALGGQLELASRDGMRVTVALPSGLPA